MHEIEVEVNQLQWGARMGRQANPDAEPTIRTALKYLISFQTGYKSTEMYKYSYNLSE